MVTTVGQDVSSRRPLGFWTLVDDTPDSADEDAHMLSQFVVPQRLTKHEVPQLLLNICQAAAGIDVAFS